MFEKEVIKGKYTIKIEYYPKSSKEKNKLKLIRWFVNGVLHRDEEPAQIQFRFGKKEISTYYKNGVIHRDDGPAVTIYSVYSSFCKTETYYKNGEIHRDNGPAVIRYSYIENVLTEEFYKNGSNNPVNDHPSKIEYNRDTRKKQRETWIVNGKLHRIRGPAEIIYNERGIDIKRIHYENNVLSNLFGPAVIVKNNAGDICEKRWVIKGKDKSKEVKYWIKKAGYPRNTDLWTEEQCLVFQLTWL